MTRRRLRAAAVVLGLVVGVAPDRVHRRGAGGLRVGRPDKEDATGTPDTCPL